MIDYIKQNHLGIIIVLWLAISSFGGGGVGSIARDTTTITNPHNFTQGVTGTTGSFSGEVSVSSFIQGGSSFATTTNDAGTFTAAQICDNTLIVATPNVGAVTLTFPTTAQFVADCLPTIGDSKVIRLSNATTTTGSDSIITLANGANGDHQKGEGGSTVIEGLEWAEITFMNIDGTNHLMDVRVTETAD